MNFSTIRIQLNIIEKKFEKMKENRERSID